jgi:2-amino-4-hydroxy-6-hydroxymethyldihydropteridine diphosphokinase
MPTVYLGLGSNVDPEKNLRLGVNELRRRYGDLAISSTYRNAAVGFEGDDFWNLVVGFESEDGAASIQDEIEIIHGLAGRQRGTDRYSSRPLDIDLLLYGDLVIDEPPVHVPRSDVLTYNFVLRPLAELAPDLNHPETGRAMAEHWRECDTSGHPLTLVDVIL